MNKLQTAILSASLLLLSGCELIGDIFKAGVWTGILLVAVVVGLILFVLARLFGKK